jgi:hypothetical protein
MGSVVEGERHGARPGIAPPEHVTEHLELRKEHAQDYQREVPREGCHRDFGKEWGPSINDRTHVISGIVYYYPTSSLSVSLAALVQSGQPINRIPDATIFGTTDLNGDGRSFGDAYVGNSDRSPGESRNSDRLPWSELFDIGIQYNLAFNTQRIELRADIFNLFNTANLSGYTNNATQSNQIQVGPAGSGIVKRNAGPPRQFQFGLRYTF